MAGEDIGSFDACNRIVELVMAKDAICEVKPCSFNGVYQPSLSRRSRAASSCSSPTSTTACSRSSLQPSGPPRPYTYPPSPRSQSRCASASRRGTSTGGTTRRSSRSWRTALSGASISRSCTRSCGWGTSSRREREIELGKRIDGTELGWCLGATLAMVGAELKCRI
ncbi:Guanosine-diphosphatase [Grifola frondosa]|uniref:Guanosine-diphosphatase n=1 Tax=Grifola frondosa TaxID=5627 RepID=A0A1C7LVT6_GRIFR|nr:Guanosine-diphosphatase [Grifola frondosa]